MKNKTEWDGSWPRYDPLRGYMLCEPCWNLNHWIPHFNAEGKQIGRRNNCRHDGCGCGCTDRGPRKPKFTGEGQTEIPMTNALEITPRS